MQGQAAAHTSHWIFRVQGVEKHGKAGMVSLTSERQDRQNQGCQPAMADTINIGRNPDGLSIGFPLGNMVPTTSRGSSPSMTMRDSMRIVIRTLKKQQEWLQQQAKDDESRTSSASNKNSKFTLKVEAKDVPKFPKGQTVLKGKVFDN